MKPLTPADLAKLNTKQLMAELAKRMRTEPVGLDEPRVLNGYATCPHCGHRGPIARDFGTRVMRGALWPQSWCRTCRAGRNKLARLSAKLNVPVSRLREFIEGA